MPTLTHCQMRKPVRRSGAVVVSKTEVVVPADVVAAYRFRRVFKRTPPPPPPAPAVSWPRLTAVRSS